MLIRELRKNMGRLLEKQVHLGKGLETVQELKMRNILKCYFGLCGISNVANIFRLLLVVQFKCREKKSWDQCCISMLDHSHDYG